MSSSDYRIYLASVFQLSKTLVVKSEATAAAINAYYSQLNLIIEPEYPETWKYYMNLAGEYHVTDTMMRVKSLDTLEEIDFTVENLFEHRATRRDYQYGGVYYDELLRRYPSQELLINGILNPIDKEMAIKADDHTILFYDKNLVETTETNLIPGLQRWIYGWFKQWDNREYELTDDLYAATMFGIMFSYVPSTILGLRLQNCHTNFVHSFHLWAYLESHGGLGRYKKYLTTKQALFLYRNIKYISRHAGKEDTFRWLIQRILTERNLPLSKYDIHHTVENMPDELSPNVVMTKKPLNIHAQNNQVDLTKSVGEILQRENPLARDNPSVMAEAEAEITHKMRNSLINRLPTKVLESSVIDASDIVPVPLAHVLLNEWIYQASSGRYTAMLSIVNPFTNEAMPMSVKDAFITYLYCVNRLIGVELPYIPTVDAKKVRKPMIPTFAELRKLADPHYVPDCMIRLALEDQPILGPIISTELFYEKCVEIQQAALRHREIYALREHYMARGQTKGVTDHFYMDYCCVLAPENTTFEKFFFDKGWFITELSQDSIESLAMSLSAAATGANLNVVVTLKEIQVMLLRLMGQLGSYTTHYLNTISTADAIVLDWAAVRVGDVLGMGHDHKYIDEIGPDILSDSGMSHGERHLHGSNDICVETKDGMGHGEISIDTNICLHMEGKVASRYWLGGSNGHWWKSPREDINDSITVTDLSGLELFYIEGKTNDLDKAIVVTDLPGFGENILTPVDQNLGDLVGDLPGFDLPPLPAEDLRLGEYVSNDLLNEFD